MKNIATALLIFLFTHQVYGMEWSTAKLTIHDIQAGRGGDIVVYVFLQDGFPKDHTKALARFNLAATQATQRLDIQVPDTSFAIKVHHDEDLSGTVTKNWTGIIPAEGLGFSSGAKLGFGPPSFKDAMMTRPIDGVIRIHIVY